MSKNLAGNEELEDGSEKQPEEHPEEIKKTTKKAKPLKGELSKVEPPKKKELTEQELKTLETEQQKQLEQPEQPPIHPQLSLHPFSFTMKDGKMIKTLFEALSSLISETRMMVDPEKGMSITAMDGAHICLIGLNIKKSDFTTFDATQHVEMGLNLEDVTKIVKRIGTNDTITFSLDNQKKRLIILMKPESSTKARKFTIGLIDIEVEEINLDSLKNMSFENDVTLNSDFFDEALKDAEIYSEVLNVTSKGNSLIFSTEGQIGDMEYMLEHTDLIQSTFTKDAGCSYSIQFLKNVLKIVSLQNNIQIQFGEGQPLHFVVKLLEHSEIEYYLSPRVDEDKDYQSNESDTQ